MCAQCASSSSRAEFKAEPRPHSICTGKIADEIDPLSIPKVKDAYEALTKLDGLDLWYTIVTRELEATCHLHGGDLSTDAHSLDKTRILRPEKTGKLASLTSGRGGILALSTQYDRMKKENMKLRAERGLSVDEVDKVGIFYRKSLARAIREQVRLVSTSFCLSTSADCAVSYYRKGQLSFCST